MRCLQSNTIRGLAVALALGASILPVHAEEPTQLDAIQGQVAEPVEGARARMADESFDEQKVVREVRTILSSVVSNALDGDMDGYLKYLSTADRDRLKEQEAVTQVQGVSDTWKENWEARYQKNLKDTLRQATAMPLEVTSKGEKVAEAVLVSPAGRLAFNIERGGWFDTSWRVDVSDNTTKEAIAQGLQESLKAVATISAETAEESAQQIAYHLLKPLASGTM